MKYSLLATLVYASGLSAAYLFDRAWPGAVIGFGIGIIVAVLWLAIAAAISQQP